MVSVQNGEVGFSRRVGRPLLGVLVAGAVVLGAAACSSESDGTPKPTKTTTTKPAATPSTAATPSETTAAPPATTSTTVVKPANPAGPTDYAGRVDGQKTSVKVTFTRNGGIKNFVISGLAILCQPLDNGDSSSRATKVSIPSADIRADGSVEHTETGAKYKPTLSGTFTADGSFAGGVFLSGEEDGSVCGGEFTFIAKVS